MKHEIYIYDYYAFKEYNIILFLLQSDNFWCKCDYRRNIPSPKNSFDRLMSSTEYSDTIFVYINLIAAWLCDCLLDNAFINLAQIFFITNAFFSRYCSFFNHCNVSFVILTYCSNGHLTEEPLRRRSRIGNLFYYPYKNPQTCDLRRLCITILSSNGHFPFNIGHLIPNIKIST